MKKKKILFKKQFFAFADILLSFVGFMLVLFLSVHLIFDATILLGPKVFNEVPEILHNRNLTQIFVPLLIIGFFIHIILALRRFPFRIREISSLYRNIIKIKHLDSLLWVLQCLTGFLLLFAASFHMFEIISSGLRDINAVSSAERSAPLSYHLFYYLLMFCAITHASIGLYRISVKWIGSFRKIIIFLLLIIASGYFSLSILSINKFYKRGQIQYELKVHILQMEEFLKIETKDDEVEAEAKKIMKNLSDLDLELSEELFNRLHIDYNREVHEYLNNMDVL